MDRRSRCEDGLYPTWSPWENGYVESFNARLRDELLDGEIFYTLREAKIVIESWRRHYNAIRPHAWLGYRAPARRSLCRRVPRGRLRNSRRMRAFVRFNQLRRPRFDCTCDET
jgi:hypothetical protein